MLVTTSSMPLILRFDRIKCANGSISKAKRSGDRGLPGAPSNVYHCQFITSIFNVCLRIGIQRGYPGYKMIFKSPFLENILHI